MMVRFPCVESLCCSIGKSMISYSSKFIFSRILSNSWSSSMIVRLRSGSTQLFTQYTCISLDTPSAFEINETMCCIECARTLYTTHCLVFVPPTKSLSRKRLGFEVISCGKNCVLAVILFSYGSQHDDRELGRILENTNLDEYELIDVNCAMEWTLARGLLCLPPPPPELCCYGCLVFAHISQSAASKSLFVGSFFRITEE